jgi:hypothetical protein
MKRGVLFFVLIVFVCSCIDLDKKEQLQSLKNLNTKVDNVQLAFEKLKKDTIEEIIYSMKEVNYQIKYFIKDDTISLQQARKLEAYKNVYHQLLSIENYNEKILFGSQRIKNNIEHLQADIEQGNGERNNYDRFIGLETKKVTALENLLLKLTKLQNKSLTSYKHLHREVETFASKLEEKHLND